MRLSCCLLFACNSSTWTAEPGADLESCSLWFAGQLRVLPHAAEVLNRGSRITACSLHRDVGGVFAAPDSSPDDAAPVLCLVCKSDSLDILVLPTMATLLAFCNVSEGSRLLSNAAGRCHECSINLEGR